MNTQCSEHSVWRSYWSASSVTGRQMPHLLLTLVAWSMWIKPPWQACWSRARWFSQASELCLLQRRYQGSKLNDETDLNDELLYKNLRVMLAPVEEGKPIHIYVAAWHKIALCFTKHCVLQKVSNAKKRRRDVAQYSELKQGALAHPQHGVSTYWRIVLCWLCRNQQFVDVGQFMSPNDAGLVVNTMVITTAAFVVSSHEIKKIKEKQFCNDREHSCRIVQAKLLGRDSLIFRHCQATSILREQPFCCWSRHGRSFSCLGAPLKEGKTQKEWVSAEISRYPKWASVLPR
jgi:hypothetical protein